jgi:hypothetical protein
MVDIRNIQNWLNTLEASKGKYKLSKSAFHKDSLDATSLALDLKYMLGLKQDTLKESLEYFNKFQGKSTGFFHEPFLDELDTNIDRILEMSGTYLGYQVSAILLKLGVSPKYHFKFYEQFLNDYDIKEYMTNFMPWDWSPMGAGNMCDHGITMMRMNVKMGYEEYQEVINKMYQWFEKNQNKNTGFWGSVTPQGNNGLVQAGYHLMRGSYFYDKKEINYIEKILDTTLKSINECPIFKDGVGEDCHDMDHFVILERGLYLTNGYRENDIKSIATQRLDQLEVMKKDDGGFSFEANNTITNHNRYDVTAGLNESDLVGTVFYLETILRLNNILGIKSQWKSSATHGVKDE